VVNNAGIASERWINDIAPGDDDRMWRVNAQGVLSGMVGAALRLKSGGSIVNMAFHAGIRGIAGLIEYSMTKGAIVAGTRSAALELGPRNIRVNCVCPGVIATPLNQATGSLAGRSAPVVSPLERKGRPEEVAALVHFLASDESAYITSQAIAVDGGWSAGTSIKAMLGAAD
jgi:NAD(P)-dependent dehydrogenase (short-subunit alcohol dehydrogenase family)